MGKSVKKNTNLNENDLQIREVNNILSFTDAGWSSLVARRAHNPKVVGSNPAPATKFKTPFWGFLLCKKWLITYDIKFTREN